MPWPPKRGHRVYVACGECGKKSLAKFTDTLTGDIIVEYVSTRNHAVAGMVMLTVRVTPDTHRRARQAGSAKLREILEKGLRDE